MLLFIECAVAAAFLALVTAWVIVQRQHKPAPVKPAEPTTVTQLVLEGTEPYYGRTPWLKGFGVPIDNLVDIRRIRGPLTWAALPAMVKKTVQVVCAEGASRGVEVAHFLQGNYQLSAGESLFVVLFRKPDKALWLTVFIARD